MTKSLNPQSLVSQMDADIVFCEENSNETLYALLYDLGNLKGFMLVAYSQSGCALPELKGSSYWIAEEDDQYRHNIGGDSAFRLKELLTAMPKAFRQGMSLKFVIKNGKITSIA